jgi:hypothetical protein
MSQEKLGTAVGLTFQKIQKIDVPLSRLAVRIGRTRAERVWRRSRLALEALRERSSHLGIDADQTNCD